jgi:peptidoglycan hydrolase-like protein with peptidoglycan-binding domain
MKKYIGYVIVLSLFVFPAMTFAMSESSVDVSNNFANYSIEKLQALIAQLQKQLETLKSNQVQCNIADMDLSLGDGEDNTSKEQVKSFQLFLKEKGYISTAQTATGYFGKITRSAVIAFQKASGIEQTGELDSATRTYIKTLKCQKNYFKEVKSEVKDTEVKNPASVVSSISLTNDGNKLTWSVNGYSKNGFKIVWSKNSAPTYPTRDGDQYQYLSEPTATNTTIDAFNGSGTYYARVCEYLGGACGVYSNEIQISL